VPSGALDLDATADGTGIAGVGTTPGFSIVSIRPRFAPEFEIAGIAPEAFTTEVREGGEGSVTSTSTSGTPAAHIEERECIRGRKSSPL
jgi:hypothetical protein